MSLKDKKSSACERIKNERLQCEEKFEIDIVQANEIADPAERVLKLDKIRRAAHHDSNVEKGKILLARDEVYPDGAKQDAIYWGLVIPTICVGSTIYAVKRYRHRNSFQEQLEKEAEDHFKNMSDKQTRLAEMIDAQVEEHVQEISQSPKCNDVLNDPDLVRKFAAAAVKKGISLAAKEEEPQPQPPKTRVLLKTATIS